jgi:hypothetical protein
MIVSKLTIEKSYMDDTGTFVCVTPELMTATFKVDVINSINGKTFVKSDRSISKLFGAFQHHVAY